MSDWAFGDVRSFKRSRATWIISTDDLAHSSVSTAGGGCPSNCVYTSHMGDTYRKIPTRLSLCSDIANLLITQWHCANLNSILTSLAGFTADDLHFLTCCNPSNLPPPPLVWYNKLKARAIQIYDQLSSTRSSKQAIRLNSIRCNSQTLTRSLHGPLHTTAAGWHWPWRKRPALLLTDHLKWSAVWALINTKLLPFFATQAPLRLQEIPTIYEYTLTDYV